MVQCGVWVLRCRSQHAEQLKAERLSFRHVCALLVGALRAKVIMCDLNQLKLVMICDGMRWLCLRQVREDAFAEMMLIHISEELVG